MLLQREVPQPQLQTVAVTGTKGPDIVQRDTAVRALQLAPDIENGHGGTDGEGSLMGPVSQLRTTRPNRPRRPDDGVRLLRRYDPDRHLGRR